MKNIGKVWWFIFLLFLSCGHVFSQETEGIQISDRLYNFLTEKNIHAEKHPLAGFENDYYPYSIVVNIDKRYSEEIKPISRFVVGMSQSAALLSMDKIANLLETMEHTDGDVIFTLALWANENPPVEGNAYLHPKGSQLFLDSIADPENCGVVILQDVPNFTSTDIVVIPGTNGNMAPLWILQQLPITTDYRSILTHKLNITDTNPVLESFLNAQAPALVIEYNSNNVNHQEKVFAAVETMITNFPIETNEYNDSKNYIALGLKENIWVTEHTLIMIYLLIIFVVIALISGVSFLGKKGLEKQAEFKRIWYLIPITIFISFVSLLLGDFLVSKIFEIQSENTLPIIAAKTLCSFVFVSIIYIIQVQLRIPITQFAYGFLLTLSGILNIIIFSSIDLVLLVVFLAEYLIIYFTRLARRLWALTLSMFLMLIPFIPYLLSIWDYSSFDKLLFIVYDSQLFNLLYACILIPFQIMWLRILVRITILGIRKNIPTLKMWTISVGLLVAMLIVIIGIFIAGYYLLIGKTPADTVGNTPIPQYKYQSIGEQENLAIDITVHETTYLELRNVDIQISSDLPILRYEVSVKTENILPVYDSVMDYTISHEDGKNIARFIIPDYPAHTTNFSYIADKNCQQEVEIVAYVALGEQLCAVAKKDIILSPQQ